MLREVNLFSLVFSKTGSGNQDESKIFGFHASIKFHKVKVLIFNSTKNTLLLIFNTAQINEEAAPCWVSKQLKRGGKGGHVKQSCTIKVFQVSVLKEKYNFKT